MTHTLIEGCSSWIWWYWKAMVCQKKRSSWSSSICLVSVQTKKKHLNSRSGQSHLVSCKTIHIPICSYDVCTFMPTTHCVQMSYSSFVQLNAMQQPVNSGLIIHRAIWTAHSPYEQMLKSAKCTQILVGNQCIPAFAIKVFINGTSSTYYKTTQALFLWNSIWRKTRSCFLVRLYSKWLTI